MAGYNEAFASFYDSLIGGVDYASRAHFFLNQVSRFRDRCELVLDLACGTGSLSLELSKRGKEVIAVDGSPDMLMQATGKTAMAQPPVLYLCQPMEHLDLYGTVDAAFCMQDSLNHLTGAEAVQATFDRLRFFVEPGGIFIFDMNTPYKHREVLGNSTFVYDQKEVYCVWQNFYNVGDGAVDIELDFFEKEGKLYRRSSESFREYSYPPEQIGEMLKRADFTLLEIQGDYTGLPPTEQEERLVYIAKRN
ncbi:MAG: class I SAM-dependent methyltransferase [Angelakisella sp.]